MTDNALHGDLGGTMTWQDMTLLIATTILPMDPPERTAWLAGAAATYARCMRNGGYGEHQVETHLANMLARVTECVGMLEQHGGVVGTA